MQFSTPKREISLVTLYLRKLQKVVFSAVSGPIKLSTWSRTDISPIKFNIIQFPTLGAPFCLHIASAPRAANMTSSEMSMVTPIFFFTFRIHSMISLLRSCPRSRLTKTQRMPSSSRHPSRPTSVKVGTVHLTTHLSVYPLATNTSI